MHLHNYFHFCAILSRVRRTAHVQIRGKCHFASLEIPLRPRVPDFIDEVAVMAKELNVPTPEPPEFERVWQGRMYMSSGTQ